MKIDLKKELAEELRNVADKMRHEPSPMKKIYIYSAAYGIVDRTMRYDFSKDLLLAFTVLNVTYNSLGERAKALQSGDQNVPLTIEQLNKAADLVDDLGGAFQNDDDIDGILKDIALLAYRSTGPGHYMDLNGSFDGML